jgi:hypothetical protein
MCANYRSLLIIIRRFRIQLHPKLVQKISVRPGLIEKYPIQEIVTLTNIFELGL